MTEEEKKAIEKLKSYKELFSKGYCEDCNELCAIDNFPSKDLENNIDTLLNLIEKLQKENIKLKQEQAKRSWIHVKENGEVEPLLYISKDKIREKIKELEEYIVKIEEETCGRCITIGEDMTIRYLKELLEEEGE